MISLRKIIREEIEKVLSDNTNGIVAYHCGREITKDELEDVVWFSSKPIPFFGKPFKYKLNIQNPLVIDASGTEWSYPLWYICCDEDGVANISPDDEKLSPKMPSFLWQMVQESSDELTLEDLVYIVANMCKNGELSYDSIIIKGIAETPAANIVVDDYIVWDVEKIRHIDFS